jgi:hypothetical protein
MHVLGLVIMAVGSINRLAASNVHSDCQHTTRKISSLQHVGEYSNNISAAVELRHHNSKASQALMLTPAPYPATSSPSSITTRC